MSNRLKLNADKTDFILLGTRQQLDMVNLTSIDLDGVKVAVSNKVKCLGVTVDGELTFTAHIKCLSGRCLYQLRQLRTVCRSLSVEAAQTLVSAFVISHVDNCNSVFGSTCATHLQPLKSILNAAARLIVKKQKYDHITASLRDELHRLPIHYKFIYKLCLFNLQERP